jgi:hypothetical protein
MTVAKQYNIKKNIELNFVNIVFTCRWKMNYTIMQLS